MCDVHTHRNVCCEGLVGGDSLLLSQQHSEQVNGKVVQEITPLQQTETFNEDPGYSSRMKNLKHGNLCTLEPADLQQRDNAIYYFSYWFRNATGYFWCKGDPGVRLHILTSPVSVLVEELVSGQDVLTADQTVSEGQRMRLTCAHACAAKLNPNLGYIWYKNGLQLNSWRKRVNILDPISSEDTGSYVCILIGYNDLPSPAVNLTVQERPRDTLSDQVPYSGPKMDRLTTPTLTHGCDKHGSVEHIMNCQKPKSKSLFTFSIMAGASFCAGLVIAVIVTVVIFKTKKKKTMIKKKTHAGGMNKRPISAVSFA